MLMKELLSEVGSIYVHCDWRVVHYLKLMLDEVFGRDSFRNEIVWQHQQIRTPRTNPSRYAKSHETILWYSKRAAADRGDQHRRFRGVQSQRFNRAIRLGGGKESQRCEK